ncbi:MAG: DUF1289 domain-containing protein [Pseudomonadota bacterium]
MNERNWFVSMSVKTPCVGICSTGIGDSICRGCKRYLHEVVSWNGFSETEKQSVLERLIYLMAQVIDARMAIVDETLMRQKVSEYQGQVRAYDSKYMQAFELIKCLQDQVDTAMLTEYGIELRMAYWSYPLRLLFKDMDDTLYSLSQAHYERYFGRYTQASL